MARQQNTIVRVALKCSDMIASRYREARLTRKSLNRKNLVSLGADALADLLLEAIRGDAARQRRVRMALAANQSPQEAASDVRRRFASIRRARGFIAWRAQRTLARELTDLIGMIETRIGPEAPDDAFDLLWSLLQLAPGIYQRTDDSNGTLGDVMDDAMQAMGRLAPRLTRDPVALADSVFDALRDNDFGEFDHAVPTLSKALGPTGLAHLKTRAEAVGAAPLEDAELARYDFVSDPDRRADLARDGRDLTLQIILQDVADLQGDVEAWLAHYTAEQLTYHTIAPNAAQRLLAAGRPDEALRIVENALRHDADSTRWMDTPDLDAAHFDCLKALGRETALSQALRARFERRLCPEALRQYLKRLPDFEDEAALEQARAHVLAFPAAITALGFCLSWPDPALAAQLVQSRAEEINGDLYGILTPAADTLAADHPLAAVLLWRAMIGFALENARATRYRHAARHLAACAAVDAAITDYGPHPDHAAYVQHLQQTHGRKQAFWNRTD